MKNNLPIIKYHLNSMKIQTLMCFIVILINILISFIVTKVISDDSTIYAGSSDIVAFIWFYIWGIGFFKADFKFMLANGITRKKIFKSSIEWMLILSAIWALVLAILLTLCYSILKVRITNLYTFMYQDINFFRGFIWFFFALFLLLILGWFISLLYYRCNKNQKLIVTFVLFVFSSLVTFIHFLTNGTFTRIIISIFKVIFGLSSTKPNIYFGALSLLVISVIFCAINYLMLLKAEIKD